MIKLKYEALKAERTDSALAQRLWVRVLAASSTDPEAIEAIQRIALNRVRYSGSDVSEPQTAGSRSLEAPVTESSVADLARTIERTPPKPTFEFEVVTVDEKGVEVKRDHKTTEYRREDLGSGVTLDIVMIPGGTFHIGSSVGKGDKDEYPQHRVSIKPFLMAKHQVTQAQWRAVVNLPKVERDLNLNPSRFEGNDRPVERVSWDDAVEFCKRLSTYAGREYRLPTEAEWEYACRAGTTTPFHFGDTLTADIANYDANYTYASGPKGTYREQTVEVGSFPANAFGLHDMHGNVYEWCADHWHDNYESAPTDGSAWITDGDSDRRLLRGGSWVGDPILCRSANRYGYARDVRSYIIGFRVVCAAWTLA
ncbi:MAG: formylglycine-generating enzyme family protein [Cyanobacteria bacterium P01_D01_bin.1]